MVMTGNCAAVITSDQAVRGGKVIELKKIVDSALEKCPSVRNVFVAERTSADVPMKTRDVPLNKVLQQPV